MNPDSDMQALAAFLLTLGACGYMGPAIYAAFRLHPRFLSILALNLFFGWCIVGWLAALAWASLPFERARPLYQPTGPKPFTRIEPRL